MSKAVVVTTAHRGVFFGYVDPDLALDGRETITLTQATLCVSWSSEIRGFMGLAVTGPDTSCKIGPAAKSISLNSVTAVIECTKNAAEAWEKQPWNG